MTEVDWAVFSALLVDHFPDALYYAATRHKTPKGPEPPRLIQHLHLADAVGDTEAEMHFDHAWQPTWHKSFDRDWWTLADHPQYPSIRMVRITRSVTVMPKDHLPPPLCLGRSQIDVRCRPGVKDDYAVARRLFRLVERVATNKLQRILRYPSYETIRICETGGPIWLGHDAIRWAREDPRRLLGQSGPWSVRPLDV